MTKTPARKSDGPDGDYTSILADLSAVIEEARGSVARTVNATMTAAYWLIGRRIVEHDQAGEARAAYGTELLKRLSTDLTARFGRGFSVDNLEAMRAFYHAYPAERISETLSRKSLTTGEEPEKSESPSRISTLEGLTRAFRLSWSHYVLLVRSSRSDEARHFYETEALRGGWSVRQLRRQIGSQFYERTALSKDKAAMLTKSQIARPEDAVAPLDEIKDPYVLEFLDLKDEYSESDLEEALIRHLETFLLELGSDFCFIGRQKRLRVGDAWYRKSQHLPAAGQVLDERSVCRGTE